MTQTPNFQLNQWSGTDYVRRTDFNADNLKIDTVLAALNTAVEGTGNCRIATGSYAGTGTGGADHPTSLTFPFEPKLLIVLEESCVFGSGNNLMLRGQTRYSCTNNSSGDANGYCQWDGNTVTWHSEHSNDPAKWQMNARNVNYCYLALG